MAHFIPCKNITDVVHMAHLFFLEIYRMRGLSIVSDWDTRFLSYFLQSLWRMANTLLDFSSAYHPYVDGQMEVVNCSLGNLLRCLVGNNILSWDTQLSQTECAIIQPIIGVQALVPLMWFMQSSHGVLSICLLFQLPVRMTWMTLFSSFFTFMRRRIPGCMQPMRATNDLLCLSLFG